MAGTPRERAAGDDDIAWGRSQADEALARVIATPPVKLPDLPSEPAARRRAITVRGW